MLKISLALASNFVLVCGLSLYAQAPNPKPNSLSCIPSPGIKSFTIEHPVDLSALLTSLTPTLAPDIAAQLFGPNPPQVRQLATFDASTNVLNLSDFIAPAGTPTPVPATYDVIGSRFIYIVVAIDKVYSACAPYPTFMLTGTIRDGGNVFAPPAGAPYAFGFRYTNDPIPVVHDLVGAAVGLATSYDANVSATLSFQMVKAAVVGGPNIITKSRSLVLDGSLSTGASLTSSQPGGALTYQWSAPTGGVSLITPDQSQTLCLIDLAAGTYPVQLTVRNSLGETDTVTVNIVYQP